MPSGRSNLLAFIMALMGPVAALAQGHVYNMGRTPTPEEIRAWDIAIGPEGKELPPGRGTAKEGAKVYAQKCAVCHGANAEGGDPAKNNHPTPPPLVGGRETLYR